MASVNQLIVWLDDFQRSHGLFGFPFAVAKKFGDDRAGNLAALIAYYGFFSVFPLMVVFTTIVGFVLQGDPERQQKVFEGLNSSLPIVAAYVKVGSISGSGVSLVVGLLILLWAGLGATEAAQNAFNDVWYVPMRDRPNFWLRKVRDLLLLLLLGGMVLASTAVSTLSAFFPQVGWLTTLGSLVINLGLFLVAFRVLTTRPLGWRDVFPGAVSAATLVTVLQIIGIWFVQRQITEAGPVYGSFALVIGIMGWFYLAGQLTLYAAELNTVLMYRLWPRGLAAPTCNADRQMEIMQAEMANRYRGRQLDISVRQVGERPVGPDAAPDPSHPGASDTTPSAANTDPAETDWPSSDPGSS
jgi:membrane protein